MFDVYIDSNNNDDLLNRIKLELMRGSMFRVLTHAEKVQLLVCRDGKVDYLSGQKLTMGVHVLVAYY